MRAKGLINKIAQKTHRTQSEARRLSDKVSIRTKYIMFGGFIVIFVIFFLPTFIQVSNEWDNVELVAPIDRNIWRATFSKAPGPCPFDVTNAKDCPASPLSRVLWKSKLGRSDANYRETVRRSQGREFWVGAEIPLDVLKKAASRKANYFLIGWLRATFRMWVDDKLLIAGDRSQIDPLTIPISLSRLLEPRPLRIAVQIYYDSGHPFPDYFNTGPMGEGFLTLHDANSFRGFMSYLSSSRIFAIFLANLLIASMFFMFWLSAKSKQEYFYMAVFVLISALSHVPAIDFINVRIHPELNYSIGIILQFIQASFAMFLGMSFARTRAAFFRIGIPLMLLAPFAILSVLTEPSSKFYFREILNRWVVPGFSGLGATICLIQAHFLFSQRKDGSYVPVRMNRLIYFAFGLIAMGMIAWLNASVSVSATKHAYWYRFANLALIYLLGVIVFNEYKDRELQSEKTPVSEYHRRPVLPEKISGAILVADLKASEPFYRHRASQGTSENLVTIWRTHFYTSIMKFNGTIIHKKGDEVIGFFDQDKSENPLLDAIRAVDEMSKVSELLEAEFKNQQIYPADAQGLHFRAATTLGEIRPVWETLGNVREAYWEEAGSSSPFVESSRLLEMERKYGTPKNTLLVVPEKLVAQVIESAPALVPNFKHRNVVQKDKHGQEYHISIYEPDMAPATTKKAA